MKNVMISRRRFLIASAAGAALAGLPEWFAMNSAEAALEAESASPKRIGPNDTINIGVIGTSGSKAIYKQGTYDALWVLKHPGTKVVAACDVDRTHLEEAGKTFGPDCKLFGDFRELLRAPGIDAVIIGTPDHWHTYIAIAAMKAGKDVYCEKPLTLTIDEGKKLVRVWKETGAVFQVGSQQRSDAKFRLACELVRNGRLGKLKSVESRIARCPNGGPFKVEPVPSDLDWDMWLGQAPMTDYVKERTHVTFRWWQEYSGGMMTDIGAHHNDIAQWGMGTDRTGPISVEASGVAANIGANCYNTFVQFDVLHAYANGVTMRTTSEGECGIQFEGEDGWIFVTRGKIKASDERLLTDPLSSDAIRLYASDDHAGDWVHCLRARRQPICDAEIGHRSATTCHLGNISLKLGGRKLDWDPVKEEFVGDKEANALLTREQRKPWRV